MGISITYCPPQAAHQTLPEEPAWGEFRVQPISTRHEAGEFASTGLDFGDYLRGMHLSSKRGRGYCVRTLATPDWAVNPEKLAEVIAYTMEQRAGYRNPTTGTPRQRVARAQTVLLAKVPTLKGMLARMCAEYVAVRNSAKPDAKRLRFLEIEIQGLDNQLRLVSSLPAKLARVAYLTYCMDWDSVAVGTDVGIMPTHVRKLLWTLRKNSARIEAGWRYVPRGRAQRGARCWKALTPKQTAKAVEMFKAGRTIAESSAIAIRLTECAAP